MKKLLLSLCLLLTVVTIGRAETKTMVCKSSTFTFGDKTATYTDSPISLILDQNTSSTGLFKDSSAIRIYSGYTFTVSLEDEYADNNYRITQIKYNCTTAGYSSSLTNQKVSYPNNTNVTGSNAVLEESGSKTAIWTAPEGEYITSVQTAITTKIFISSVEITYEQVADNALGGIQFIYNGDKYADNNGSYSIKAGSTFKVFCRNATSIEYKKLGDEAYTSVEGSTLEGEIAFTTYTFRGVMASDDATEYSDEFNVTFTESFDVIYNLVKSADDLVDGGKYIVVYKDSKLAMSNTPNSNTIPGVGVTITNDQIINPTGMMVLKLEITEDGYYWNASTYEDGSYYLVNNNSSKNYLQLNKTKNATTVSDISGNGNYIKINFGSASGNRYLQYNTSTSAFATYTSSQGKIQLYQLEEQPATTDPEVAVISSFADIKANTDTDYQGNATIEFRRGNDIWLSDDSNVSVHATLKTDDQLDWTIGAGYVISNFRISSASAITKGSYDVVITTLPTTCENANKETAWITIAEGQKLTEDHVGKPVVVSGEIYGFDNDDIMLESGDEVYLLHRYFEPTEVAAAIDDEENDWVWDVNVDNWLNTETAPYGIVYVSGMVALHDSDVVIYPIAMTSQQGTVTGIETINSQEVQLTENGVVLPAGATLYSINGARVAAANLSNGIYIVRYANGKAAKVYVK
jgi:hypothetical protein